MVKKADALRIRRALPADAAALAALAERTFRDAFAADNTADDMNAYCAEAFTIDVQRRDIADESMDTLVIENESSALVAYAQLRPGAPEEISPPSPLELWRFYVDRSHHGKGIAQELMRAVLDSARARGARTLWLGVWERNLRAQAFYRTMGFVDIGAHTFLLGSDAQTDRLMALHLPQESTEPS
jgi:ribosomal protein S18 acetylase RimI-like enzyme